MQVGGREVASARLTGWRLAAPSAAAASNRASGSTPGLRPNRGQPQFSQGDGAGLVQDEAVNQREVLEEGRALYQDAVSCCHRDGGDRGSWGGQDQGAGAGGDQHRKHRRCAAGRQPQPGGGEQHQHEVAAGIALQQPADRRLRPFGGAHQRDHPAEGGRSAGAVDTDGQDTVEIDRAGEDRRARPDVLRHRFACERRCVEAGVTAFHHAIGWNQVAGAQPHPLAGSQRRGGHLLFRAGVQHAPGSTLGQPAERGNRFPRTEQRALFQHMTDGHHHGEQSGGYQVSGGPCRHQSQRDQLVGDAVQVGMAQAMPGSGQRRNCDQRRGRPGYQFGHIGLIRRQQAQRDGQQQKTAGQHRQGQLHTEQAPFRAAEQGGALIAERGDLAAATATCRRDRRR